jgi:fatty acid desaturase
MEEYRIYHHNTTNNTNNTNTTQHTHSPSVPRTLAPLSTRISNHTRPILGLSITLLCIQFIVFAYFYLWSFWKGEINMMEIKYEFLFVSIQLCIYIVVVILASIVCKQHQKNPNVLVSKKLLGWILAGSIVSVIMCLHKCVQYYYYYNLDHTELLEPVPLLNLGLNLGILIHTSRLLTITYPDVPMMTTSSPSYPNYPSNPSYPSPY